MDLFADVMQYQQFCVGFNKEMYTLGKFGVPYFHEFATDSYETSHIY